MLNNTLENKKKIIQQDKILISFVEDLENYNPKIFSHNIPLNIIITPLSDYHYYIKITKGENIVIKLFKFKKTFFLLVNKF